jgi:hypothetical protein
VLNIGTEETLKGRNFGWKDINFPKFSIALD